MSLAYEISPSCDQVRVIGAGELTTTDLIEMIRRIHSDPRCLPESTALVDLRDATYDPKDQAEVVAIAEALEKFRSVLNGNIAIVAERTTAFLAALFSTHVSETAHVGIKVFADITAAKAFCSGNLAGASQPTMNRH